MNYKRPSTSSRQASIQRLRQRKDNFERMDAAGKDAGDRIAESMRSAVESVAKNFAGLEACGQRCWR